MKVIYEEEAEQNVELKKIDLNQKHSWSQGIKKLRDQDNAWLSKGLEASIIKFDEALVEEERRERKGERHFFQCRKCDKWTGAERKAFDLKALDAKTGCSLCKKTSLVKLWRCRCQKEWHQCREHRGAGGLKVVQASTVGSGKGKTGQGEKRRATEWEAKPQTVSRRKLEPSLWGAVGQAHPSTVSLPGICKRPLPIDRLPPNLRRRLYPHLG